MGWRGGAATDVEGGGRQRDPLPDRGAPWRDGRPGTPLTAGPPRPPTARDGRGHDLADVAAALADTLRFHRDMGITELALAGRYLVPADEVLVRQEQDLQGCRRCKLSEGRTTIVFGSGSARAEFMCIGEGPGADEDAQGKPFVGRAGQLLTRMLESIHLVRDETYIGNVVKCRPPGNRNPEPEEIAACMPFLLAQIAALGPKVILSLGSVATQALLGTREPIGKLRGRVHRLGSAVLVPTFHPAFLLRNPGQEYKRMAYEDLKLARRELDQRRTR